jgi:hypothetical protein
MKSTWRLGLAAGILVSSAAAALLACGSDPAPASPADAGSDRTVTPPPPPPGEGGADAPSGATVYTVPAGGGTVTVTMPSGNTISMTFAASAAGTTVTLTPATGTDIGWTAADFSDVLKMEPNGTTFADPVLVTSSTKDVLLYRFPTSGGKSAPTPLQLDTARRGFLLPGFSWLGIVEPSRSCGSTSGWILFPNGDSLCADAGAATKRVSWSCSAYDYCHVITAGCCIAPTPDGGPRPCKLDDSNVSLAYQYTDNGGTVPHCVRDGGGGDAGPCGTWTCGPQFDAGSGYQCACQSSTGFFFRCQADAGQCECLRPNMTLQNDGQTVGCGAGLNATAANTICLSCL